MRTCAAHVFDAIRIALVQQVAGEVVAGDQVHASHPLLPQGTVLQTQYSVLGCFSAAVNEVYSLQALPQPKEQRNGVVGGIRCASQDERRWQHSRAQPRGSAAGPRLGAPVSQHPRRSCKAQQLGPVREPAVCTGSCCCSGENKVMLPRCRMQGPTRQQPRLRRVAPGSTALCTHLGAAQLQVVPCVDRDQPGRHCALQPVPDGTDEGGQSS